MAKYRLSQLAFEDFRTIFKYTAQAHGLQQAQTYRDGLKASCRTLTENPEAGESANHIQMRLRSFIYRLHRIYYVSQGDDILIVRVLHQSQDAKLHV